MEERRFRPLRPAGPANQYYQDYFTDSPPEFCDRLAQSFVALLREKRSYGDEWWSLEVKDLSDPAIQKLLTRIILEKPCNVAIQELKDAFEELKPTKAIQTHFKRLWDVLDLQDSNPAMNERPLRHESRIIRGNKNEEPALIPQVLLPPAFRIPDRVAPSDPLWGVWPCIDGHRQLICPPLHVFSADPCASCFPIPTMNGYISNMSENRPQPLKFHGPFKEV